MGKKLENQVFMINKMASFLKKKKKKIDFIVFYQAKLAQVDKSQFLLQSGDNKFKVGIVCKISNAVLLICVFMMRILIVKLGSGFRFFFLLLCSLKEGCY